MKKNLTPMHDAALSEVCEAHLLDAGRLSRNRLIFARSLIDAFHTYGQNDDLFGKFFKETVGIDSIKRHNIIDFETHYRTLIAHGIFLSNTEAELHCFMSHNFTARELRIIYRHSNPESIYIRMNRIRKKLEQLDMLELVNV